jgi:hypothetical protein
MLKMGLNRMGKEGADMSDKVVTSESVRAATEPCMSLKKLMGELYGIVGLVPGVEGFEVRAEGEDGASRVVEVTVNEARGLVVMKLSDSDAARTGVAPRILVEYEIIQCYDDQSPELFGHEKLDHQPVVGEVLQLHWIDGREAHRVVVRAFHRTTVLVVAA